MMGWNTNQRHSSDIMDIRIISYSVDAYQLEKHNIWECPNCIDTNLGADLHYKSSSPAQDLVP